MIGEPVVVTPPRKKESIAVDLVAVKKAVDASSTVQEARRIAREAKEQASRASVTAEAIAQLLKKLKILLIKIIIRCTPLHYCTCTVSMLLS